MRLPIIAFSIVMATATATAAQAGELSGVVRDSSAQPVAAVQVVIPDLGLEAVTAADGSYQFDDVAEGEHRVGVDLGNGNRQFASALVPETGEVTRNFFLYNRRAVQAAETGVNPMEAMLLEALAAQAWDAASEITSSDDAGEAVSWRWRDLDG